MIITVFVTVNRFGTSPWLEVFTQWAMVYHCYRALYTGCPNDGLYNFMPHWISIQNVSPYYVHYSLYKEKRENIIINTQQSCLNIVICFI